MFHAEPKHEPGVYRAPSAPGWTRIIAVGADGDLIAISEFRNGTFDIDSETRRLLSRMQQEELVVGLMRQAVGGEVPSLSDDSGIVGRIWPKG